ncbi:KAP family P-loop NTPase fold protein [Verminephrobacter aporrectodeae]|uniref:KAP family P-loop NTPase fold protein n=1 Tax=Verminephrobacter aporrectodeae TaxID=1110389 RepID=UPI00145E025D|nr:P-loop NTPase fold protein [Verminephrobacter aporrectodeae]
MLFSLTDSPKNSTPRPHCPGAAKKKKKLKAMTTKPFFHSDRPAEKDALGWSDFAENLARSLSLPEGSEGIVVGIEGEWGSGKSTLIGLIKKSLLPEGNTEPKPSVWKSMLNGLAKLIKKSSLAKGNTDPKPSKPIIIEFNPWMVSGTEALVETLIIQIAVGIGKNPEKDGLKTASKLLRYGAAIAEPLKILKCFPGIAFIGNISEAAGNAFEGFNKHIEKNLSKIDLSKRKEDVVEGLNKLGQPLIIIIDDLDRLPPEEIRSMIQTVKAVLDFPRTLYLLAYDRSIVARTLGSSNEEDGLRY